MSTAKRPAAARVRAKPRPVRVDTRKRGVASGEGKEFMASLAKGLAVLAAFNEHRRTMSLTEAAGVAGLSRAAARRVLLTLAQLGYVEQNGREFFPAPRVLELGFGYLSTQPWIERTQPLLKELSVELREACSAATLQGTEVVFVAQATAPGVIMSTAIATGTRMPAFHTALGRIQLGFLDEAEIWRRLRTTRIEYFTPHTITDPTALVERVKEDRRQGFSIVDEELERGVRSLAVPLVGRSGRMVGAINITAHASRTTRNEMRSAYLPRLQEIADKISKAVV